jgi:transposase
LFTRNGKALTAKGVKPICPFQQVFKSLYLFGAFSPINGDKFLLEMPNCDAINFQLFLNEFSAQNPTEFKIIVLDNGAFHKAKSLIIPENIGLIFLPPYSPELNPAEKIWAILKRKFTNKLHKSLEEVSQFITEAIIELTPMGIKRTCGFEYILLESIWTI